MVVGPWSDALSEFVGQPIRLVQPTEIGTGVDRAGGGVSILSTGSLEAIREAAGISEPVDPRRFRMLFGVEGVGPHEEDAWVGRRVQIGEAEVEVLGNVGRCLVTSRHPDSGARNLPTLDVLAEYRGDIETTERLPFGVWGGVTKPGVVHLGDARSRLTDHPELAAEQAYVDHAYVCLEEMRRVVERAGEAGIGEIEAAVLEAWAPGAWSRSRTPSADSASGGSTSTASSVRSTSAVAGCTRSRRRSSSTGRRPRPGRSTRRPSRSRRD